MPRVFYEREPDLHIDLSAEQQAKIHKIKNRADRWPTPKRLKCLADRSDHAIIRDARLLHMDGTAIAMLLQDIKGTIGRAQHAAAMGGNGERKARAFSQNIRTANVMNVKSSDE